MPLKQTAMFDEATEAGAARTIPGMAHWVDVGRTDSARCRTCAHYRAATTKMGGLSRTSSGELKPGQCELWYDRVDPKLRRVWPKIPHSTKACKYHEEHGDPPAARE